MQHRLHDCIWQRGAAVIVNVTSWLPQNHHTTAVNPNNNTESSTKSTLLNAIGALLVALLLMKHYSCQIFSEVRQMLISTTDTCIKYYWRCLLFLPAASTCVCVHMHVHLSSLSGVWLPLKGLPSTSPGSMGTCALLNPPFGCGGLLQTNRPALRPAAPQVGSWLSLPSLAKKPLSFLLRSLICFT